METFGSGEYLEMFTLFDAPFHICHYVIPTNTILYKKLTGLGATYGELKAHRNSIIIEPNKPVISGKCKDPKHGKDNLFGVFDGVYADDIVADTKAFCSHSKNKSIGNVISGRKAESLTILWHSSNNRKLL